MNSNLLGRLLMGSAALALSACGGGGGSHVSSTPPPTDHPTTQTCPDGSVIPSTDTCPPPPPQTKTCPDGSVIPITDTCPPPPPPPPSPAIFRSVTADTEFAVLGLGSEASALVRDGFSVRYDAATQGYLIDTPLTSETRFTPDGNNSSSWDDYDYETHTSVWVLKPRRNNPEIALAYTSLGRILQNSCTDSSCAFSGADFFAFGLPTSDFGIPVTGTATYNAIVAGITANDQGVGGDATLQFDFGAGTLAGHFDPILVGVGSLGTYDFVNTVFGVGSTNFSGKLSHSGTDSQGDFDGLFTGPTAQELMARWTAPYQDPTTQQWSDMYGVWVGTTTKTCPDGAIVPAEDSCSSPPPPGPPAIFPGLAADTNFATLGFEQHLNGSGADALVTDGFSVSYDAATQGYFIQLPHQAYSPFVSDTENGTYWVSYQSDYGGALGIFKPSPTNPEMELAYTSYGHGYESHLGTSCDYYGQNCGPDLFNDFEEIFAFGLPTTDSGIPVTGTASYDALVVGRIVDYNYPSLVGGDATLQFDFGSGTLAGHFDPVLIDSGGGSYSLDTYSFVNTVFGVGSTSFSGKLSQSGNADLGSFNGLFTGPTAQELMARWTASYKDPFDQQLRDMYGIWVGKKQ